jgi:DNA-3-methyladenine glycosylase
MKPNKSPLRLPKLFYEADTLALARDLLGTLLVRHVNGERLSGIIVETEAYLATGDPASHSHRGPNRKNAAMFMPAGTLYVYSIHAKYCMNIVTEDPKSGAAVLVRALEPYEGIEAMQKRRGREGLRDLCSGPARLCQAMAIDAALDKLDLTTSDEIWLEEPPSVVRKRQWEVAVSPRIGISSAQDALYRYFIDGHYCVSGLARLHSQKRAWLFVPQEA